MKMNHNEPISDYIKRLETIRRDFVANVSHELRTPLTVIRGYLEALMQQDNINEKSLKKIFSQMHHHSLRMENIIEDLLLLSRLESEDHPDENNKINIADLLTTLCKEAQCFSGNKNHKITLAADINLFLSGSENELRSLFSNIIINAVKYTPEEGDVNISWYKENNQAVFVVSDSGYGIEEEHIPRITERFYRVDKARSRESGGTGLGLAIVKHVLLRHQGELTIESQIGLGSTFTCAFPGERVVAE